MLALIPLFPLVGFLINGVWYGFFQTKEGAHKSGATAPGVIATLAIFASFVVSVMMFIQLHGMAPEARSIEQFLFHWMTIPGGISIDFALRDDSLSTLFTLVITGVGTLIHLYSIGYMSHDETPTKFFAYLNLFCFAMLILVLGSSLPVMFLGWEGVGLCSYLLIGYWYTDMLKAQAGKKAFIVNRVGDFGFLLGIFSIFAAFGTLDFGTLREMVVHGHQIAAVSPGMITAICLFLFVGCCGKSAQIPLYIWLPDAMAGPTPVSALIHAATMVTSGIYMISRLNFLYSLSPSALHVVAVVGCVTAFFAATIALVQTDIKKVLAYSTVSQLGYMFLACGVGAYAAGVFHVITHAFFKALLFLGAGSVIHGMHEEQNIMNMGGLRKKMPITFITFLIASLAISGIPPFSGFFSKDEILWQSFSSPQGSVFLWALGWVTAIMTAFYMFRLVALTFFGSARYNEAEMVQHAGHGHAHGKHGEDEQSHEAESEHHAPAGVHESPAVMTIPLQILAVLSLIGGFIGLPHMNWLEHWLEPVIPVHEVAAGAGPSLSFELALMAASVVGAILGIAFALNLYKEGLAKAGQLAKRFAGMHKVLENKWYVDEIYDNMFVQPVQATAKALWKGFDVAVIDRIVLSFGWVSTMTGQAVRTIQTGSIQLYAFMFLVGIVATVGYLIYGLV